MRKLRKCLFVVLGGAFAVALLGVGAIAAIVWVVARLIRRRLAEPA